MRRGLVVIVALVLSGCAGAGPTEQQPGSITPGDGTFLLTIDVVSATRSPTSVVGASVSSGDAKGNVTQGTTDDAGTVTLSLRAPQVIALEVSADGYAGTGTVPLRLGAFTGQEAGSQIGAVFVCAFSFGMMCPVDATIVYPGPEARIRLQLVPSVVAREIDISMSAATSNPATGQTGMFAPVSLGETPELDELYSTQLRHVDGKLAWTNEPGSVADLEFALFCGEFFEEGAQTDQGSPASLVAFGARELSLTYTTPQPCAPLYAGAWVDSATTDMVAKATLHLRFGPGIQRPR